MHLLEAMTMLTGDRKTPLALCYGVTFVYVQTLKLVFNAYAKTSTVCLGLAVTVASFQSRLETSSWRPLVTSGMTPALFAL